MFQFPGFALLTLCIQAKSTWITRLSTARRQSIVGYQVGCPIRKFRDQRVLSPPPDLSQSATSFIASYRQGIHQTPFSRLIRSRRGKTWALLFRSEVILSCQAQRLASESPNFGQCIRLGKTVLACPAASRRTPHESNRAVALFDDRHGQDMSASPTWDTSQERLVFLSLHDVKVAVTAEIFMRPHGLLKVITNTVSSSSSAFRRESLSAPLLRKAACRYATTVQTSVEFLWNSTWWSLPGSNR